jgi:hypothetical protein
LNTPALNEREQAGSSEAEVREGPFTDLSQITY